jgi:hypothetical protein
VPDAFVEHVVVEHGTELGAVVGLDDLHLEWQALQDVVGELDGGLLVESRLMRRTRSRVQSSMAVNW